MSNPVCCSRLAVGGCHIGMRIHGVCLREYITAARSLHRAALPHLCVAPEAPCSLLANTVGMHAYDWTQVKAYIVA